MSSVYIYMFQKYDPTQFIYTLIKDRALDMNQNQNLKIEIIESILPSLFGVFIKIMKSRYSERNWIYI